MKINTKVNGKDVLWRVYTLRFTNFKSFEVLARKQQKCFSLGAVNGFS